MATRSANVMVRVEPEVKEQAEKVMDKLGLSASTAINLFYLIFSEVILWRTKPLSIAS